MIAPSAVELKEIMIMYDVWYRVRQAEEKKKKLSHAQETVTTVFENLEPKELGLMTSLDFFPITICLDTLRASVHK